MQPRYRPYRWGNRVAVGVLAGQVIGMLHSPLDFPGALPAVLPSSMISFIVADVTGRGAPAVTEVAIARTGTGDTITIDPGDYEGGVGSAPGTTGDTAGSDGASGPGGGASNGSAPGGPGSGGGPTTGVPPSRGDGTGSDTTTPGTTPQQGSTTSGTGGSSTTRTSRPTTTGSTTSSTDPGGGSASTSTDPGQTTTTEDGGMGPVLPRDPCRLPADAAATWVITLAEGSADTQRMRIDVVAAAAELPAEQFVALSDTAWRTDAAAGPMCTVSLLVEVVAVSRLG